MVSIGDDRHIPIHFANGKGKIGISQIVIGDDGHCRVFNPELPVG
jgi:hypothetical protein